MIVTHIIYMYVQTHTHKHTALDYLNYIQMPHRQQPQSPPHTHTHQWNMSSEYANMLNIYKLLSQMIYGRQFLRGIYFLNLKQKFNLYT